MNYDEFAFFNQQLSVMLRDGSPLEGALKQLCAGMNPGPLRAEMQKLVADLEQGTKLITAIARREFPVFYKQMIGVGVRSNDLPSAMTVLADYYQRKHLLWTRLKGLMFYPLIVLCAAFGLSCAISFMWSRAILPAISTMSGLWDSFVPGRFGEPGQLPTYTWLVSQLWAPPILLGALLALVIGGIFVPRFRAALCWRLPVCQEASVAQTAWAMWALLHSGVNLNDAIRLLEESETATRARADLAMWRQKLASGVGDFAGMAADSRAFPRLFIWLTANGGEDLAAGFKRAGAIYQARSQYRADTLLHAVLPVAMLSLGLLLVAQAYIALSAIFPILSSLINVDYMHD